MSRHPLWQELVDQIRRFERDGREATGLTISPREWAELRLSAPYPMVFNPVCPGDEVMGLKVKIESGARLTVT